MHKILCDFADSAANSEECYFQLLQKDYNLTTQVLEFMLPRPVKSNCFASEIHIVSFTGVGPVCTHAHNL